MMRIYVYSEAIPSAFAQHANSIVHKIVVVYFTKSSVSGAAVEEYCHDIRSFMLEILPGNRVAQYVKTPTAQTGKVNVGRAIVEIKWTRDEVGPASFGTLPKSIQKVRGFTKWSLGRAGKVDPAK